LIKLLTIELRPGGALSRARMVSVRLVLCRQHARRLQRGKKNFTISAE
jgi:hypothetical protein